MSEAPLKCTLKAGTGYDAPWLTVDGGTPDELEQRLRAIAAGGVIQATIEAANALKAANNAAPLLANGGAEQAPQQEQAKPQGWGQSAPQPSAPQQQSQPREGGWNNRAATQHPEGLACPCGNVLEYGKTRTNKGQWKCPDYRWNNGNPNEHRLEWA